MDYYEYVEKLAQKIKEDGSSFFWENREYVLADFTLSLIENKSGVKETYPLFKAEVERGLFLVRIKSIKLLPMHSIRPQIGWTRDRYICICKYKVISSGLGDLKAEIEKINESRNKLRLLETTYQQILNEVTKELSLYAD